MTLRSRMAIVILMMLLMIGGFSAIGRVPTAPNGVAAQDVATPVVSVESLVEIELTAVPKHAADAQYPARVSFCIQYQTPAQSVGNPPPYGNSPVYLYWWDAKIQQWQLWLESQTDGTGCGMFPGLVPNNHYAVRARLKVQSPIAQSNAGLVVDAWTKSFYISFQTEEMHLGNLVLPVAAP